MDLRRRDTRASCIQSGLLHVVSLKVRLLYPNAGRTLMPSSHVQRSIVEQSKQEPLMSLAAVMVHVDIERDSAQIVQLALALADRFQAALIGVAGCAMWPAFMAGDVGLSKSSQYEFQKVMARFEQRGKKFRAQGHYLKQVEWRSMLETPGDLLLREARAADLLIIGRRRSAGDHDPGVILLRAGRPILLVPDIAAPLELRRVVIAWKDTRECRRAVRDALPLLQEAKEVLLVEIGEHESRLQAKKTLGDVAAYLVRHRVIVADQVWRQPRRSVAAELFQFVEEKRADLIVAGGYGHSRLGELIFGGVTHELLTASPVCCMLSH
jgi:nucleotide-binding universal stress UspA family protein